VGRRWARLHWRYEAQAPIKRNHPWLLGVNRNDGQLGANVAVHKGMGFSGRTLAFFSGLPGAKRTFLGTGWFSTDMGVVAGKGLGAPFYPAGYAGLQPLLLGESAALGGLYRPQRELAFCTHNYTDLSCVELLEVIPTEDQEFLWRNG
jgi:hypothetical protein